MPDQGMSFPPSGATTFVNGGSSQTIAQLLAAYPASVDTLGLYARVSDLYGSVDDIMRCRWDGVAYRWVPQRDNFNATVTASGNVSLVPLVTAPTVKTAGNLLGNISFTPSTTNAYVGQRFRVIVNGTLGLFTATVTGLLGSNITLLGNTSKDVEYSPSGWFAVSG